MIWLDVWDSFEILQYDWQPRKLVKIPSTAEIFSSLHEMPSRAKSREDILRRKEESEQGYQPNAKAKAKKREKDRAYQQKKPEQAQLHR